VVYGVIPHQSKGLKIMKNNATATRATAKKTATAIATSDKKISPEKVLRTVSAEISKRAKTLGADIHKHNCDIMAHIIKTRDVTVATHFVTLLMAMKGEVSHSTVRSQAVLAWFTEFGFVKWSKTKDGKPGFKLNGKKLDALLADTAKDDLAAHIKLAKATKWNELTPEKPIAIYDFDAAFATLIKTGEKKANETLPEGKTHKVTAEHLAKARALAVEMGIEIN
jgi:hypothetical protein